MIIVYKVVKIKGTVRVPPNLFSMDEKSAIKTVLQEKYERTINPDLGLILVIMDILEVSDGIIIPGDGASYHDATYEILVFKPELHEIVEGEIKEIVEFGAFVNIGCVDGLVHVSQVLDDFISYDKKTNTLSGKKTKAVVKKEDKVRAKVISVSMKNNIQDSKIGLTMRSPGLGRI